MFSPRSSQSAHASHSHADTFFKPRVQPKLAMGTPGDRYEVEADRTADKVVSGLGEKAAEPFFPPKPAMKNDAVVQSSPEVVSENEADDIQEKTLADSITPLQPSLLEEPAESVQEQSQGESVAPLQASLPEEPKAETETPLQAKPETASALPETSAPAEVQASPQPFFPKPVMQQKEVTGGEEEVAEEEVQEKQDEDAESVQLAASGDEPTEDALQASADGNILEQMNGELREPVQKKAAVVQTSEGSGPSDISSRLASSKGGGSPMSEDTQSEMGSSFGADFSGVRVHTDDNAVQMNRDLGAQAFANGNDIYFNSGKYDTQSTGGKHLLAHELTHTIQQGASPKSDAVQKAPEQQTAAGHGKPVTPLDITHRLELTDEWAKYLDAQYAEGKRKIEVDVKIGDRYSGVIELNKVNSSKKGETAKYKLAKASKRRYLDVNGWEFFDPLRGGGLYPILVLNDFGDDGQTTGFLSLRKDEAPMLANVHEFLKGFNSMLDKMRFLGIEPLKIVDGFENKFETGRLIYQISTLKTVVDGYLEAGGGMGITGDVFTFNANAKVSVPGLAEGELMIARGEDGTLSGSIDINADIANVQASLHAEYIDGAVTIQGTGRISSEKFDGEITLLVTDTKRSKQMMNAALGVESMDEANDNAATEAAPKTAKNQVLAAWGEVSANITPWLAGTAKVGIDAEGHVTIVGEISVPSEVELMEQRGKKVDIFKVEIRAGYGIPLLGQVFLFASIGMFMNAGFGPLVLKNVAFTGTYSTDPDVLQNFSVTGTLGINAFAVLGLEAEAGVGLTLLGHDLKAGVNVTAAAGLRAYAEATPTLEYKEQKAPEGGKTGETRLKGHFEAAAQLFLQLSGALFTEIDSPWWSPVPDGREEFPLGEVQYPIGDTLGIGADMDWLVGSPDIPEISFSPIEFDPDKFTADVMADPPPGKKGDAKAEPDGTWVDGNAPGEQSDPPQTTDGPGLPDNEKKKEDLKKLPDEEKYMRALDEMSKFENANPKATLAVVEARAKKVKSKYGLEKITVTDNDDMAEIYVKHKEQDNGDHILEVPLMSEAERAKLLSAAMEDLKARETSVADPKDGTIEENKAKELLADWQKANPVAEEAHVKDGGDTWDYFIDIGDKTHTEKGKRKKNTIDGEVPKAGDGELGTVIHFIEGDEKHTLWIDFTGGKGVVKVASTPEAVEAKLQGWELKLKGEDWKNRKVSRPKAEGLIRQVRSMLQSIDADISEATTPSDTVSEASVNASDTEIEQEEQSMAELLKDLFQLFNEKYDFNILFMTNLVNVHPAAKDTIEKSADIVSDSFDNKSEIRSWNTLKEWLQITQRTDEIFDEPINNELPYGVYVKAQIEKVGSEAFSDLEEVKRKEVIREKLKELSEDKNAHAFKALQNQVFDKSLESDANEKLKSSFLSGKTHGKYNPKEIRISALGNQLLVEYDYTLEENGKQILKSFRTTVELSDIPEVNLKQTTTGTNIALKDKGSRGNVNSANNQDANDALKKRSLTTQEIKFNASHILADWFQGPGYLKTLNLMTTSDKYNVGDMLRAEEKIANGVKNIEDRQAEGAFVTFDLKVTAHFSILTDATIVKAFDKTEMTDAEAKSAYELLKKHVDPRLLEQVDYEVLNIYLNGDKSKALDFDPIDAEAGRDETLSEILK